MARRISQDEAREAIHSALQNAGGRMTHNDLVNTLTQAGKESAIPHLPALIAPETLTRKVIKANLEAGEKPTLWYFLPGTPTTIPAQPGANPPQTPKTGGNS